MPVPISRVLGQLYLELPNRRTLLQYVDEYEVSAFRPIFPVIEPDIFRQTVNTTYQLSSRDRVSCSAKLSMLCFFHFFNTLRLGPTETDQYKHDLFEKSQTFLESILAEPASIDGIQALVMMLFLAPLYGDEELFISYHSAAWAMILNMGGHANLSVTVSTNTHLRNLFWLCYTIDKGAFPGHYRQFSLIDDTLCDLSLPTGYVDRLLRNLEILPTSKRPFEGAIFPADIRLSIIKSKIFTAFLSPTAIQKPTREVLRDIRFLDKELEDWRSSISSTWNLTLFVPTTNPKVEKASFHMFMLRLDYYWCITNIHHACYQLTTLSSVCYNLQQCINSSFAICLEASRSALLHLQVASKEYTTGRFGYATVQFSSHLYFNLFHSTQICYFFLPSKFQHDLLQHIAKSSRPRRYERLGAHTKPFPGYGIFHYIPGG
jgi:hypothetical protein